MIIMQDNVSVAINILLACAWDYSSDFINSGQIVLTVIVYLLQHQCHLQVGLQLWRSLLHDLVSLFIQRHKWVVGNQHILEFPHEK